MNITKGSINQLRYLTIITTTTTTTTTTTVIIIIAILMEITIIMEKKKYPAFFSKTISNLSTQRATQI
jgi:hypothetical protein